MRYDSQTQEMQFEPPIVADLSDRPLPAGLDRAKGWGWGFDPIEVAKINEKRIAQGLKPLMPPSEVTL